jgi:hypothetical protein
MLILCELTLKNWKLIRDRQSNLLKQKVAETTLIVHSVTSMDDAIDAARE